MPLSKRSRGERDAPRTSEPTGQQHGDAPRTSEPTGQPHGDAPRTSEPTGQQHLYLIFDDWEWGYSIRKLKLPLRSAHQPSLRPLEQRRLHRPAHKRLPPPCICLEAPRHRPSFFAAVGTDIIAAHPRNDFSTSMVEQCFLPIFNVHSLGVRIGPGLLYRRGHPFLIPVGDEKLFALGMESFRMLSMKPPCSLYDWSWCDLPLPPLESGYVTSFAVGSDGRTIFASTDCATFTFDIGNSEWKQSSNCSLPFTGAPNYVHALDIFVGLSKAPDTYGHICFCRELSGDKNVRFSKENLLFTDAGSHVAATLVYLRGTESGFCLVECLRIREGKSVHKWLDEYDQLCGELDQLKKNVDEGDGTSGSMQECGEIDLDEMNKFVDTGHYANMDDRYVYRLITFSLSFDNNGDLTTGETSVVQLYEVPKKVSEAIYLDPVAFWL